MIVAGTENASIYQDIRFVGDLNSYVNKLSEFMTTKSVYLDTDKQRMVLEEDSNFKNAFKKVRNTGIGPS